MSLTCAKTITSNFVLRCSPFLPYSSFVSCFRPFSTSAGLLKSASVRKNLISEYSRKREDVSSYLVQFIHDGGDVSKLNSLKPQLFATFRDLSEKNFDAIFMRSCALVPSYAAGRAFLKQIEDEGRAPNVATLSNFLRLCYKCQVSDEVENICNKLLSHKYLNSESLESIVSGLCLTDQWKTSLEILPRIEEQSVPSQWALSAIALSALKYGDLETLLLIVNKLLELKKAITDAVFESWIDKSSSDENLLKALMTTLTENELYLSKSSVEKLKQMFESKRSGNFGGKYTKVDSSGKCYNCNTVLKPIKLEESEYAVLKNAMLDRVLQGPDVYIGSTPEEVQNFQKFIEINSPFDVVIDGMNVAYHIGHGASAVTKVHKILSVVDHFHNQKKKILVFVKKHVLFKWKNTRPIIENMRRKAHVYAIDDMSRDDVFILYAALHSGSAAQFVSVDLMRDHKFRLRDDRLEFIFRQWQRSSQLRVLRNDDVVEILPPPPHQTIAQSTPDGQYWHVPYDDGRPRFSYQLPTTWLCLKRSW